jgi:hypothetical protein
MIPTLNQRGSFFTHHPVWLFADGQPDKPPFLPVKL